MTTTMGPSSRGSSSGMPRNRSGSGEGPLPSGHGRLDEGGHRAAAMGKFEGGKYVEGGSSSDAGDGIGGSGGGAKVIRYTREKMLSLRGRGDEGPPECLKELEGSVVISEEAQDPGEFLAFRYFDLDRCGLVNRPRPSVAGSIREELLRFLCTPKSRLNEVASELLQSLCIRARPSYFLCQGRGRINACLIGLP